MGTTFHAQNRERTKALGATEGSLQELKASRYIREHRHDPAPPEELAKIDAMIRPMARNKLLQDFEDLHSLLQPTFAKLEKTHPHLGYNDEMYAKQWLKRIEVLQREHPDFLHLSHLLTVGDGGDSRTRDLHLGYQWIVVLTNGPSWRSQGYLNRDFKPLDHLHEVIQGLLNGPLDEHIGAWWSGEQSSYPRELRSLPVDPTRRARILSYYIDYLNLAMVERAFNGFGGPDLSGIENAPRLLSFADFQLEEDRRGYFEDTIASLASLLEARLAETATVAVAKLEDLL